MIARPLESPRPAGGTRAGRIAAVRRRSRSRHLRYRGALRVVLTVGALTVAVMLYLGLLANITRLHYEIARAERTRVKLEAQTSRLDERMAQLQSSERLVTIAAELRMHDPNAYAVVTLGVQPPVARQLAGPALLGALAGMQH